MKVAVFYSNEETIVVGLNQNGSPMDSDGTLFGKDSGRNIEEYDQKIVDIKSGEVVLITNRQVGSVV